MKRTFAIVLEPQEEGGFTVTVPALPEVVTEGETESEALAMAREAIALAIEHRRAKGMEIPADRDSHVRLVSIEELA
jgi:antitoxin HicB